MKITTNLTRETDCKERGRQIMIQLHPHYVEVWLKGERQRYTLSWSALYWAGAAAEAASQRRERQQAKKGNKS